MSHQKVSYERLASQEEVETETHTETQQRNHINSRCAWSEEEDERPTAEIGMRVLKSHVSDSPSTGAKDNLSTTNGEDSNPPEQEPEELPEDKAASVLLLKKSSSASYALFSLSVIYRNTELKLNQRTMQNAFTGILKCSSVHSRIVFLLQAIIFLTASSRKFRGQMQLAHQFVLHTWRQIKRSKLNFCLGFFACLLVVLVVAVLITGTFFLPRLLSLKTSLVLGNTPVVFLRLAELEVCNFHQWI